VTRFSVIHKSFHKTIRLSLLVILGLWSLFSLSAETVKLEDGSQLELKGIGLAQEFKTDIYIGALYAPVGYESIDLIKDYTTPKRITIRYLPDSYSYRKVSRHFKERIAMNMAREEWQPLTREIITFSRIFKDNFQTGDEIRLDFIPGKGTSIYLNDVLFETIANPEFINLIINSWTGAVPPTKAFKEGILGQLPNDQKQQLVARFASLTPIKGRFTLPEAEPETAVAEVKTSEPKAQDNKKPATNIAAVKQTTVSKPEIKTPSPSVVAKKQESSKKESKQIADSKAVAEQKLEKREPTPQKPIEQLAKKEPVKTKPAPVEEDFVDEDLIRGSYIRDLIAEVRKKETYPRKALINNEEGDGVARVVIDREGNIIDVVLAERTGSRELDKGILTMIRRSTFLPVPKELKVQEFEFEIPFSFKLGK
jgi:TonB family protein